MATIKELETKYNELNSKYQVLEEENKKKDNILKLIQTHVPHLTFDKVSSEILYFTKIGKVYYLNNNKQNNCIICGKDKPTTAHHLIPRRAKCKNRILKELRIRICEDCNKLIHPENKIFRKKVLERKEERIANLKNKLAELKLKVNKK